MHCLGPSLNYVIQKIGWGGEVHHGDMMEGGPSKNDVIVLATQNCSVNNVETPSIV